MMTVMRTMMRIVSMMILKMMMMKMILYYSCFCCYFLVSTLENDSTMYHWYWLELSHKIPLSSAGTVPCHWAWSSEWNRSHPHYLHCYHCCSWTLWPPISARLPRPDKTSCWGQEISWAARSVSARSSLILILIVSLKSWAKIFQPKIFHGYMPSKKFLSFFGIFILQSKIFFRFARCLQSMNETFNSPQLNIKSEPQGRGWMSAREN